MDKVKDLIQELICTVGNFNKNKILQSCAEISNKEAVVLDLIGRNENIIMRDLALGLKVTTGAATQFADKLITKKLVKRLYDKNDRRITRLTLSKKGHEIYKAHQECKNSLYKKLLSKLPGEEHKYVGKILRELINTLDELPEIKRMI